MYRSHTTVFTASWGRKWSSLLVLFAIVFTGLIQPAAAAQESRVLPQLQREAAANPAKTFRVIVTRIQGRQKADTALTTKGGRKVKNLKSVDSFVGELTGSQITALGSDSSVKFVNYDAPVLSWRSLNRPNSPRSIPRSSMPPAYGRRPQALVSVSL